MATSKLPFDNKIIIFVTGVNCAGKDYCAEIWASVLNAYDSKSLKAKAVSISDTTKREFAAATGADLSRLLLDRSYKEQQRPQLTAYFQNQIQQNPQLPEEQLLGTLHSATDADVILVTGMRDEAPVATFSHLLPGSKMIEVRVEVSESMRQTRGGVPIDEKPETDSTNGDWQPCLTFHNDMIGSDAVKQFAERHFLPLVSDDLQRLARMARLVPDFPRPGVNFCHILDIAQQPGGLTLCTSLLQSRFAGDWADVDAIAVCEAGGFIFTSALAAAVDVPLILIREEGKLPPPTVSVKGSTSHISSPVTINAAQTSIEMDQNAVSRGASVVVIDDVLASGRTLCAVFGLFRKAGIEVRDVSVMVVAEFPVHRGRKLIRREGFRDARIQSLLVFSRA